MNNTLSKVLIFTVGAAVGSAVTWKLLREKYERIAQEEIDSVKEVFARELRYEHDEESVIGNIVEVTESEDGYSATVEISSENPVTQEYYKQLKEANYTNYSNTKKEEVSTVDEYKPYVISPDEFGELDGYETDSLIYYDDGVLADDYDNPVDDIDEIVGYESLKHFGEYEDDTVFVRNDATRTDYEITLDTRKFSDVAEGNVIGKS